MVALARHRMAGFSLQVFTVPVTAVLWSTATWLVNAEQIAELEVPTQWAFLFVLAGGVAQTVAVFIGFSAIVWAMVRGFGGNAPLLHVLRLISHAFWPLWFGAPAFAFWSSESTPQSAFAVTVILMSLVGFFILAIQRLAKETAWPVGRAFAVISASIIFVSSFLYLTLS